MGGIVKRSIIKKSILHKDHRAEIRVLTVDELPSEEHSLALNRSTDTGQKLELMCGLHGHILDKLPPDSHLISPIVMVKSDANRPLKMKVTIPHALAFKKLHPGDVKVFTSAIGVPVQLESNQYTFEPKLCNITAVIDKQRLFYLTAMGKTVTHNARSFHRPPAVHCIYYVLVEPSSRDFKVNVYCTIDLPTTWKVCWYKQGLGGTQK